jgi:glutamate--cysteine ligase
MMKMTCTVQANFDFRTEADAMEIIRLCCSVGPLATALFAMSPTHLGRPSGWATWRMNIWDNTDPDRCGIPDFMLDPSAGFDDYVNWLLDVPMFFITRQGRYIDCAGVPFRQFMAHGHEGHRATWGDWQLHQSTAFPDIRLKQYLELRTCDAGPADRLLAMPALFKGLLYDAQARREAFELVGTLDAPRARRFARVAAQDGLAGRWEHLTIEDAAASLVAIARRGLDRQAGPGEPSEACFLDALLCHDTGRPLDASRRWLQQWQACGGDRDAMIRLYEVASHE